MTTKKAPRPKLKRHYALPVMVQATKNTFGKIIGYDARYGDLTHHAATPDAAVAKVEQHLTLLTRVNATPVIVQWRGMIYLATFDTSTASWHTYRLTVMPSEVFFTARPYGGSDIHLKRPEAPAGRDQELLDAMQLMAVDGGWQPADKCSIPWFPPESDRAELLSKLEFRVRYGHAREILNFSDDDAHSYAGRNPARAHLWAGEEDQVPSKLRLIGMFDDVQSDRSSGVSADPGSLCGSASAARP